MTHYYQVTPSRLNEPRNTDYKAFIERLRAAPFVEQKPEQGSSDNRLQGFMFHPRGSILRLDPNAAVDSDYLRIEEEEVPRDGIEIKRAFNYARDAQGAGAAVDRREQDPRSRRRLERPALRRHPARSARRGRMSPCHQRQSSLDKHSRQLRM